MLVSMRRLLEEANLTDTLDEYKLAYGSDAAVDAQIMLNSMKEATAKDADMPTALSKKTSPATPWTRRVLYMIEGDLGRDVEFASEESIISLLADVPDENIPIDPSSPTMEQVSIACAPSLISTPLLLTPLPQILRARAWLPSASAHRAACALVSSLIANELMFGDTLDEAEATKEQTASSLAPAAMGLGIVAESADDLLYRGASFASRDLDAKEIRRRISMHNSRMAACASIRDELLREEAKRG